MAGLVHEYTPRGACLSLMTDRSPEVLLSGPAGTGKSLACLEKLNALALKYPGMKGLIVRKTRVSLASSALATWEKLVIPELLTSGAVYFHGGSHKVPPQYRYQNGSTVSIGGMDKSSRIMSTEYDVVFVQEATELVEDDWEAITTRLRNWVMPYQQIVADCNPVYPSHWLKRRADAGKTVMYPTRHEENPVLFTEDGVLTEQGAQYMAKLDALTGVRHARLRKGLWAAAEGVIYGEFDPAVNLIDYEPIPPEWPRYWSVDFGFTNPFVCQFWAQDPDGRLIMYRERYMTQGLVEDHAKAILAMQGNDPRPQAIICDHDAEDRATLERHLGMSTVAATKTVSDGIQAVQSRIRRARDGKPRLYLVRTAVRRRDPLLADARKPCSTVEEIDGYVWDEKRDAPVKENDHGMDAMRYVVAHLDLQGRAKVTWIDPSAPSRRQLEAMGVQLPQETEEQRRRKREARARERIIWGRSDDD